LFFLHSNLFSFDVTAHFDFFWKFLDADLESALNLFKDFGVVFGADETDGKTFGTESTGSGYSMEVSIRILWHIVVENDVNSFNIDTSSEKIGGDQNSSLKVLELAVPFQSFFLVHASVDIDGWKVLVFEELVQSNASLNRFDEDNDLVEFEGVQEVKQFSVLFLFLEVDKVLSETVKGELGIVVNVNLHWVVHEFLAHWSDFFRQGGGEHHDLLLVWGGSENILHIPSHIKSFQHFVALVENKMLDILQTEFLSSDKSQNSTWCGDNNMRWAFSENFSVVLDRHASEEDSNFDGRHVLAESFVLFGDLESKLSGVAQDNGTDLSVDWLHLLESGKNEHSGFTHT